MQRVMNSLPATSSASVPINVLSMTKSWTYASVSAVAVEDVHNQPE